MPDYTKSVKKTRVLQFTIASTKGGRTRYILNVWEKIDKSRILFDFITFSKVKLDFEEKLIESGSKVYYLSCHPETDKSRFTEEFSKVLSNGYDVIEIHTSFWVSTIVEEMARKAGIPMIIIHAHSTGLNAEFDEEERQHHLVLHDYIRSQLNEDIATHFWACSREAADWLYADRISKERIEILHNTIDTSRFRFSPQIREKMRASLNIEDKFVVGTTGRLETVKNIPFALRVFTKMHERIADLFLLIVGDGSLRIELERLCVKYGIQDDVLFAGLVDNVEDYLQAMDLYMLPSRFEGFSISLLEAQCCGLPCIASLGIPQVAVITDMTARCPLEEQIWVEYCLKYMEGYERYDRSDILIQNGFDTSGFIKKLEQRYAE